MTRLSVNINKVALLRNARGGNLPDLLQVARDCERFGADGITVHPRPDERHIRYQDALDLKSIVTTEYNIEGYPSRRFLDLIKSTKPHQCTLVPDSHDVLTSDQGWDTQKHFSFLQDVIGEIKSCGCRVSLFIETDKAMIKSAKEVGTDRIELYTGPYAAAYGSNREKAIAEYVLAANYAGQIGLELNAGHDLNLENLAFFRNRISSLLEVSIGHALIADALYLGLENTIQMYKRLLQ